MASTSLGSYSWTVTSQRALSTVGSAPGTPLGSRKQIMMNNTTMDEIHELNLAYLLLAQRLLNEDRVSAKFRLKIDDDMADLIQSLGAKQLSRLSRINQLICHFGHENAEQLRQVTQNPRDQGFSQFHGSILMAHVPDADSKTRG